MSGNLRFHAFKCAEVVLHISEGKAVLRVTVSFGHNIEDGAVFLEESP